MAIDNMLGQQLGGRYQVLEVLGAGGFGRTYIAIDQQRPGEPKCVLKHLSFSSQNADMLKQARRMFAQEATTLERLGKHDQIPQLLAYFEEHGEFYLVQEFIEGYPMASEIPEGTALSEAETIEFLQDTLSILVFVHDEGVIHRDLKPENLIRRTRDRAIVMIDFGAVKTIEAQINPIRYTQSIPVYTTGYAASEQCLGRPQFNSDIYSLGMIAIQCLTGTHPTFLDADPYSGSLLWKDQVTARPELIAILDRMTQYQSSNRYATPQDVLQDLAKLHAGTIRVSPQVLNPTEQGEWSSPIALTRPGLTPSLTAPEPARSRIRPWKLAAGVTSIALCGTLALTVNHPANPLQFTRNWFAPAKPGISPSELHLSQGDRSLLPADTTGNPETQIYLNNAQAKSETYTLAVVLPFGTFPQAAAEVLRGIAQAQTEVNAKGGVGGKSVKILLADDQNKPERAWSIAQSLIQKPEILGVIGHGSSDTTLAGAAVYKTQQLVTLAPISSAAILSSYSPYLFRTMPSDRLPARALSQHMTTTLKKRRAAVFFSSKNAYSQSLKTEFKNALFYTNQGQVVAEIDLTRPDFNPAEALKLAKAKGAEVLILANSPSEVDRALLVMQTNRDRLPVLASDALYSDKVRDSLNPATQSLTLAVPTQQVGLATSPFAKAALNLWKEPITWRSALAYDATFALTSAIAAVSAEDQLGTPSAMTRDRIRQAIASPQFQSPGSLRPIRFTETGDPQEAIQLVQLMTNPRTRQSEFQPLRARSIAGKP
jgi:eukaryotic-like serine/threonine-protein kinase